MDKKPNSPRDGETNGETTPSAKEVYKSMEPFEPYTTGELATVLDISNRIARKILDELANDERIQKKETDPERPIWIRKPPKHVCPSCGVEFEIRYFHPSYQRVRSCPRCGTELSDQDQI